MKRLYKTLEQRQLIKDWLQSEQTQAAVADKYAFSRAVIYRISNNLELEHSLIMRARVWRAIREWQRAKSGQPEQEQADLPGMPPTRRSILLEMIQKELEAAGDDKLERFYKAIITA